MLRVSSSGYYAWRGRPQSQRSIENRKLLMAIKAIHGERRKRCYGSPRVCKELNRHGHSCSRNRVARLMRLNNIQAQGRRKFKVTTNSAHERPVAPNILARDFAASAPNQKWACDMTYIWTTEGWLYLAVVIDLFSRMIIGWSVKERMTADIVCNALRMAIANRLPLAKPLLHSDRGSQYASNKHQQILKTFGITCSMSRSGNCWDNAVTESFFASFKTECIYQEQLDTRQQTKSEIFDYIERFYNRDRLHSTLDYLTPAEFEQIYYNSINLVA